MVEFLIELLENAGNEHDAPVHRVQTYDEVGMLTKDAGLVVTMADGSEFQLTVVQSQPVRR